MPRKRRKRQALFLHRQHKSQMVEQDRDPRNQHSASHKINQPPEDRQRAIRKRHESQEHESELQQDTVVWYTPRSGLEEELRRLLLQC
jgi:hypothetical protein